MRIAENLKLYSIFLVSNSIYSLYRNKGCNYLEKDSLNCVNAWLTKIQKQVERPYYCVLLGFVTMMDSFVFFIPTDGLMVTSVLAYPKAWIRNAVCVSVGSVIGSLIFACILREYGQEALHYFLPNVEKSSAWIFAIKLMQEYGAFAVLFVALTPIPQPPIVALAAMGNMSLWLMGALLLLGRLCKYLVVGKLATKPSAYVRGIFGFKNEVQEVKNMSSKKD